MPLPAPLEPSRVIADPALCEPIELLFTIIRPDGKYGGITIGLPGKPRALVYAGPCPVGLDKVVRAIAKQGEYNVSAVRDESQLFDYETATQSDSKGY